MIIAIVKTLFYKKYKFSDIFVYNKTYFSNLKLKTANKKEFFGPASARSYKIGVVGNNWLVCWLVGNAVFSETALRIFLIFCMNVGDYKSRKVTEPDFWKKFLIWRYSQESLQISPKSDTLIFFSKMALTIFLVFDVKLVLNMTFNLNETCFSEKFSISRYLASKSSKKIVQMEIFGHFLSFHHLFFLILHIMIGGCDV